MEDLKITILQSNLFWESIAENLNLFSQKINAIQEATDICVLPEMFTTGFSMSPKKLAEHMSGRTVNWMREMANAKKCILTGSFICEEGGKYYNRLVWMRPDGTYDTYDKRHLFSMANENEFYTAGTEKLIVTVNGWKICPLICYDLRFPVWAKNIKDSAYDVLIYVANWPEQRSLPWKTLLLARAIENQCYVIGVNRVGNDAKNNAYSGDSIAIGPKGDTISSIKMNEEIAETVSLRYTSLMDYRKSFPVLSDADEFTLLF